MFNHQRVLAIRLWGSLIRENLFKSAEDGAGDSYGIDQNRQQGSSVVVEHEKTCETTRSTLSRLLDLAAPIHPDLWNLTLRPHRLLSLSTTFGCSLARSSPRRLYGF